MKNSEEHFFDFFLDPEYLAAHMHDEQLPKSLYRKFHNKNHFMLSAYPKKNKIVKLLKERRAALRESEKTQAGRESAAVELANIDQLTSILCNPSPISGMTVRRALVDYDSTKDWHQNLLQQKEVLPFTGVLSDSSTGSQDYINFDSRLDHDLLELDSSSLRTPRMASRLAERCKKMIIYSDELYFIDPYLDPDEPRFTNVIKEVLRIAYKHRKMPLSRLEYIVRLKLDDDSRPLKGKYDEPHFAYKKFKKDALECFLDLIPCGKTLTVRFFEDCEPHGSRIDEQPCRLEQLHDRYILTENFGLLFPFGLDEDKRNLPEEKLSSTSVTRLSIGDHESWLRDYTDEFNPAFETSYPELVIEGRRDA